MITCLGHDNETVTTHARVRLPPLHTNPSNAAAAPTILSRAGGHVYFRRKCPILNSQPCLRARSAPRLICGVSVHRPYIGLGSQMCGSWVGAQGTTVPVGRMQVHAALVPCRMTRIIMELYTMPNVLNQLSCQEIQCPHKTASG